MQEKPPGILGELDPKGDQNGGEGDDRQGHYRKNDPEGTAQKAADNQANIEGRKAKEEGKTGDERAMPKSKRHYHAMLIKEISSVMRDLNSSPPRKYSFDEWAWYLKLIGEDESSPDTHRKAIRKPKRSGTGLGTDTGRKMDEEETVKWSWIGNRSPLMGNKEEAEWVLERLTKTLERELEALRREEEEGKGDWAPGGRMEGKDTLFGGRDQSRDKEGAEEKNEKLETGEEGPSVDSSRTVTQEREDGDEMGDKNI